MSIWNSFKRIALVASLVVGGAAANATTVTFDFTGAKAVGSTLMFSSGGIDLTVGANRFNPITGAIFGAGRVTRAIVGGLGEKTSRKDVGKLDGAGPKELLQFYFSETVKITQVTFALINRKSQVTGYVSGTMVGRTLVLPVFNLGGLGITGDWFGAGAPTSKSSYRISSITVATVPVPAAGLLLLAGLGGLSTLRRKRSA